MARRKTNFNIHNAPGLFDNLMGDNADSDQFEVLPPKDLKRAIGEIKASSPSVEPMPEITPSDRLLFMSFGSGSSGNCSYVGDRDCGFLIDAGIEPDKVVNTLRANGIPISSVKGICLTHDHGDHLRYVYQLLRRHRHIALYCTLRTLNGILRRHNVSRRITDYHTPIYKEHPFRIGSFEITPFEVLHDGTDNAGFHISHGNKHFTIATDLGSITPRVEHYARMSNWIMIEANYDAAMLRQGRYPEYLKARIANDNGHLDNNVTAQFLASIASPLLRGVFLCHLSHDNNSPDIALTTVETQLAKAGINEFNNGVDTLPEHRHGLTLVALPRYEASPLYTLSLDTE